METKLGTREVATRIVILAVLMLCGSILSIPGHSAATQSHAARVNAAVGSN
jgi:hypothetical protein